MASFLQALRDAGVELLVDVRAVASLGTRHSPGSSEAVHLMPTELP